LLIIVTPYLHSLYYCTIGRVIFKPIKDKNRAFINMEIVIENIYEIIYCIEYCLFVIYEMTFMYTKYML